MLMEVTKVRRHREARQEKKELQAGRQEGERGKRVCTNKIRQREKRRSQQLYIFFQKRILLKFSNQLQAASSDPS